MEPDPLSGMEADERFHSASEPEQTVFARHMLDMHDVTTRRITIVPDEDRYRIAEFKKAFKGQWSGCVSAHEWD
mgnify:CR=1 FL=1